ncbi:MAG TPA: hypothetical protein VMR86_13905 [Myxococcota bacterium]|nr:hypothetical protein [Myxococcota bacterium]
MPFVQAHRLAWVVLVVLTSGLGARTALALTVNPIDSALPLTIHARAACQNGTVSYPGNQSNTTVTNVDMPALANCSGIVGQDNSATLTHIEANDSAHADLVTGTLGTVAIARSYSDASQSLGVGALATGYRYDTLTVNGNWSGIRNIELRLTVHGLLTSNAPSQNWISSSFDSSLLLLTETGTFLANTGLNVTVGNNGVPFIASSAASAGTTLTTNAVNTVFNPADVQFTMTFVFPATTTNRTFSFMGRLGVAAGFMGGGVSGSVTNGRIDFGNGQLSLTVPSDVTVTSASGRFLDPGPAPGVPVFPWMIDPEAAPRGGSRP